MVQYYTDLELQNQENLLKKVADTETKVLDRKLCIYKNRDSKFIIQNRFYEQQYSGIYFCRLKKLYHNVKKACEEKWRSSIESRKIEYKSKILDIKQGKLSYVIGTVFLDMTGKPNILKDVSTTLNIDELEDNNEKYINGTKEILIEDESGRMTLIGDKTQTLDIMTGTVIGVLGLENKQAGKEMHYSLTSTTNSNLNKVITCMRQCGNTKEEKEKAIGELMQSALDGLVAGKCPHPPDYIILYRQGGNYVQNRKTADNEVPMFLKYLNELKEKQEIFKKYDPKFVYVCCNLKGDLKFFEKANKGFANPKSGLCVDSSVTQKDKYEFYIQPQFVNQGTATPCHYQVLYEDEDKTNPENNLKVEHLQLLSFYLSFYYWTWAGAIRVPGALKLATTAMTFFSKHLDSKLCLPDQKFNNPIYI